MKNIKRTLRKLDNCFLLVVPKKKLAIQLLNDAFYFLSRFFVAQSSKNKVARCTSNGLQYFLPKIF